jgi:hypothetical protein
MNLDIGAVPIKSIARWTPAASIILVVNEVLGCKPLGIDPMIATLVLAESSLMPIVVCKGRIALTMAAVSYVAM